MATRACRLLCALLPWLVGASLVSSSMQPLAVIASLLIHDKHPDFDRQDVQQAQAEQGSQICIA
jgi:hypothetical protein